MHASTHLVGLGAQSVRRPARLELVEQVYVTALVVGGESVLIE